MKKLLLALSVALAIECNAHVNVEPTHTTSTPAAPIAKRHGLPKRGNRQALTPSCAGVTSKQALSACLEKAKTNSKLLGVTRPAPINPYWAVPDWFFSSAGSDNNSCIDAAHPCATPEEVYARWGTFTPVLSHVTFHILTDIDSTHLFHSECIGSARIGNISELDLVGSTITLATGSVVAATNMDRVNPPPLGTLPTIDLGVPAASFVDHEFVDVTRGSMGWIISASGNTVTTGPVMQLQPDFDGGLMFQPPELNNITIGDTWQIRRNIHAEVVGLSQTLGGCLSGIWRVDANPVSDTLIVGNGMISVESSFGFEDLYGGAYVNNHVGEHAFLGGDGGAIIGGVTDDFAVMPNSFRDGTMLDGDVTFLNATYITGLASYGAVHFPALNSGLAVSAGAALVPITTPYAAQATLWGGNIAVGGQLIVGGAFYYNPPMTTGLPGSPTLYLGGVYSNSTRGIAEDLAANPVQYYFRGPMTTTLLDTAIGGAGGTGFGGIALGFDGVSSIVSITPR